MADPRESVEGLSAPALMFLFADQFVMVDTIWDRVMGNVGVWFPGQPKPFRLGDLERQVLAWTCWHLDLTGLVKLTPKMTMARTSEEGTAPGFEGEVLDSCTLDEVSIETVMEAWAGSEVADGRWEGLGSMPFDGILRLILGELELSGSIGPHYELELVGLPGGTPHRSKAPAGDVDHAVVVAARRAFKPLADQWNSFVEQSPGQHELLLHSCDRALYMLRHAMANFRSTYPGP